MSAMMTLQRPRRSTTASTTRTDLASMPEPATTPRRDPRHHYARHAALKPLSNHPVRTTTDRTAADPGAAGAQSDMICAPQLVIAGEAPAVQNESSLLLMSSGWAGSLRSRLRWRAPGRGGGSYGGVRSGSGLSAERGVGGWGGNEEE